MSGKKITYEQAREMALEVYKDAEREHEEFGCPAESIKTVKCNWRNCAHGMGLAATDGESCYMERHGADPQDENCPKFITDEDIERSQENLQ